MESPAVSSAAPVHLYVVHAPPLAPSFPLGLGDRVRALLMSMAHAQVWLAGAAAVGTWAVQVLAGLPMEPSPALAVFLVFFSIYNLDRVAAEPETDALNHPERERFSRRHARVLLMLAGGAYLAALALALAGGLERVLVMLLPLLAVLVYSFPFVPRPMVRWLGFRRLKEILVVKNAVVAGTFATTLTLAPVPLERPLPVATLASMWVFIFMRFFINSSVFDMRDEAGDRQKGVRTLPVVLGADRTRALLQGLNLALGVFLLAMPVLGLTPPAFAALAVGMPFTAWYLRCTAYTGPMHFLCDVVVDGELYVAGAALGVALGLT